MVFINEEDRATPSSAKARMLRFRYRIILENDYFRV
jgi:hypothetical protein